MKTQVVKNIDNAEDLTEAIKELQLRREVEEQALKEYTSLSIESLKPVNIARNAVKDISSSPELKQKLLVVALGLAAGYFAKLLIGGRSRNPIKRILGAGIQLVVTRAIVQNPEVLNSLGNRVVDAIRSR
jgi:hypothetical protein